jgi:thiamine pyrophosphokinase
MQREMNRQAIIITGGEGPLKLPKSLKRPGDFVICADSGLDLANRLDIACDLWVGDFDSTANSPHDNTMEIWQSVEDQEYSDTELALLAAAERGFSQYVLIGGGGGRLDHLLHTFGCFDRHGAPTCWYTRSETLYLVTDHKEFEGLKVGQVVSFLPAILSQSTTVTAPQLAWPLQRRVVKWDGFSLSNRCTAASLSVQVEDGPGVLVSFSVAPGEGEW